VLETVRAVHRGESRMTPQIARKVMDQFRRLASPIEATASTTTVNAPAASSKASGATEARAIEYSAEALSDKEERILGLIAEGKSNKQIAAAVFLAEGTVKNYVSRIMEKLHANTRTELAVMSIRQRRGD
jgi:DNA-binding NarL/FixJ family response regulator